MSKRTQYSMLIHSQSIQYNAWPLTNVAFVNKTHARRQGIEREEAKTTRGKNYNDIALCGAVNPRQEKNTSLQGNIWVNLYPNPVSTGMLNLVYQMPDKRDDYRVTVVNMLGTQVLDIPLDGQDGAKQVNVEALQNGIYCYMVRTNEKTLLTGKFVVLH